MNTTEISMFLNTLFTKLRADMQSTGKDGRVVNVDCVESELIEMYGEWHIIFTSYFKAIGLDVVMGIVADPCRVLTNYYLAGDITAQDYLRTLEEEVKSMVYQFYAIPSERKKKTKLISDGFRNLRLTLEVKDASISEAFLQKGRLCIVMLLKTL